MKRWRRTLIITASTVFLVVMGGVSLALDRPTMGSLDQAKAFDVHMELSHSVPPWVEVRRYRLPGHVASAVAEVRNSLPAGTWHERRRSWGEVDLDDQDGLTLAFQDSANGTIVTTRDVRPSSSVSILLLEMARQEKP